MTESIPGVTTVQQAAQAGTASQALGGLGSDAFLKLLVAQLKYQNPMEPTDGTQLLQQTAQFTQVETLQSLAETQRQLTGLTQFSLAVGLSGKEVAALGPTGTRVTGLVDAVRYNVDGPELSIGGQWIGIDNVLEVHPGE